MPLEPCTCQWQLVYGGFAGQLITNAYDKVGNLICTKNWAAFITNAYDNLNRRVYEFTRYTSPEFSSSQSYSYDLADNRTGLRLDTPQNTVINTYTYDNLNRLSSLQSVGLKTIAASYSYNPNGKLASISATEGGAPRSASTFTYDSEQRLSAINGSYNNAHKLGLSYAYNNAQQITSIGETIEGEGQTYTFAYDQRDQLTNETVSGTATIYGYDKAQNRVMKKTGAATPDAYCFTFANKPTNIVVGATNANHRYFYDLAGNLVTSVVHNITNIYFSNAQNKLALIRINYPDGDYVLYNFLYDSLNRRVCIGRAEARWPFLPSPCDWQMQIHDGNVPIAVSHPADAIDRLFVRGVGIAEGTGDVIAEIIGTDANNAKAVFYLTNHRGDTLPTYRGDKTLVAKYRYDAFGNQRTAYCVVNELENAPRYTFSTKELLPKANLYIYQYRAYDPIAGRWTQRDPIDYQDSINLYQFCGNNPVNLTDRDGRVVIAAVAGPLVVVGYAWLIYTKTAKPIDDQSALDPIVWTAKPHL